MVRISRAISLPPEYFVSPSHYTFEIQSESPPESPPSLNIGKEKHTILVLGCRTDETCQFLMDFNGEKRCSIQNSKPLACRIFPYSKERVVGDGQICQKPASFPQKSRKITRLIAQQAKEAEQYIKWAKQWNRKGGNFEECLAFMIKKAGKAMK